MSTAPIQYTASVRPEFINVMPGDIIAITLLATRLFSVSSSFAAANFSSWYFSALYACTTRMPVRCSLMILFSLSVIPCTFLNLGTANISDDASITTSMNTAAAVAADHCQLFPDIFITAHTASIGALIIACSPMDTNVCTWVISLVVRFIRLAVENLFISAIEKDSVLSKTSPLSVFASPAATMAAM